MKSNWLRFLNGFGKVILPVCLLLALSACGGDTSPGGGASASTNNENPPPPPPPPPADPSAITKALEMGDQWLYNLSGTATIGIDTLESTANLSGFLFTALGGTIPNPEGPAEGLSSWVVLDAGDRQVMDAWFTDYITQDASFNVSSHGGENSIGTGPGWLGPQIVVPGTLHVGDTWTAHGNTYEAVERKEVKPLGALESYDAFRIVTTDTQWFGYTATVTETYLYVPVLGASLTVEQEVTDIIDLPYSSAFDITRLTLTHELVDLCFADTTFCDQ